MMDPADWEMFEAWLTTTDCGLGDIRRGMLFDGDQVAGLLADETFGQAPEFAHEVLGFGLIDPSYREYNNDPAQCVYLEPLDGGQFVFEPLDPGVSLYDNACPYARDYSILSLQPGVEGAQGNLRYWSYEQTGIQEYVNYAQIVREHIDSGNANWKTVVNGFSLHHLAERGCGGESCAKDSACIVSGALDLFAPFLDWIEDPQEPFVEWMLPCNMTDVGEEDAGHLTGQVNHLFPCRPNPFSTLATIRFHLARSGKANLSIYDVSGRLVKTLLADEMEAGETTVVWDGTDNRGNRVGGGIFWMQMHTRDGYVSGKKMLVLR
jgi:hypothetical protein